MKYYSHDSRTGSVPITTRQLEALIRLSQARAKACLRNLVLKEDAEDVVELMVESTTQVLMDETGHVDKGRGGVGGKSKQSRLFLTELQKSRENQFTYKDLMATADKLNLPLEGFKDFVDDLHEKGMLLRRNDMGMTFYSLSL